MINLLQKFDTYAESHAPQTQNGKNYARITTNHRNHHGESAGIILPPSFPFSGKYPAKYFLAL
jgi:hypothetical protein